MSDSNFKKSENQRIVLRGVLFQMFQQQTYYEHANASAHGQRSKPKDGAPQSPVVALPEGQVSNQFSFDVQKTDTSHRTCVGFVDVVGFSQMMQSDEDGTYQRWISLRSEIVLPKLEEHGGMLVKSTGDGIFVTFDQPVNAVRWVRDVQMESRRRRHGLMLRAALNFCRVLRDGSDLIGDGVNIAARLQEFAPAGGAILTNAFYQQIGDNSEFQTRPLGEVNLRKMKRPVVAFELVMDGRPALSVPPPGPAGLPSIAVMPFSSKEGVESDRYFATGIVDDIISRLSRMNDLTVISRSSTLSFANQVADPQSLADVLGVRYVVTGVLRHAGQSYRLSAEMLDTQNGQVLASLSRDFFEADTFAVQDEIVEAILSQLLPGMRSAERRRSLRKAPASFTAYDSYLRALDLIGNLEQDSFRQSRDHLQNAMDGDPTFSPPFAWASRWHSLNVGQGWSEDPAADSKMASKLAQQAIRMDDVDARALATFGHVQAYLFGDFDMAITYLDRARQANPNSSTAWLLSSVSLSSMGRVEEGVEAAKRALRLSPFDPHLFQFYVFLGIVHYDAEHYDDAVKWLSMGLAENPHYTSGWRTLIVAHEALGQHDAARAAAGRLIALEPGFSLSKFRQTRRLYSDPSKAELFCARLKQAGMPE